MNCVCSSAFGQAITSYAGRDCANAVFQNKAQFQLVSVKMSTALQVMGRSTSPKSENMNISKLRDLSGNISSNRFNSLIGSIAFLVAMNVAFSCTAIAAEQTYVREYAYQASEADSKISARTLALQEVKRELLDELGTHVSSLVKLQSSSNGNHLGTEEIQTLSAGVTRIEIIEEKWNGSVYILKAQIKADPEDVLKSLNKILDADAKQRQISQLTGDFTKLVSEKSQIAESLIRSNKATNDALAEITRLKKQLEEKQTSASRQALTETYQQQIDQVLMNELLVSALRYHTEGNVLQAFQIFTKLAAQGSVIAQVNLGAMYSFGEGISKDDVHAVFWFQKAAEQGNAMGQHNLGVAYSNGTGITKDYEKSVYWYRKSAEQGLASAQNNLGQAFALGEGVDIDYKQALYWFQKSADQGDADGQYNIGYTYYRGNADTKDFIRAVYWFRKAAEQGHASAQNSLGVAYYLGNGIVKDEIQAAYWYKKSAEQGDAIGQLHFGAANYWGKGIATDYKQAVYWYQKSASQGNAKAQFYLGVAYEAGNGVAVSEKQAVYWYQLSAEQGNVSAQSSLGCAFATGYGVAYNHNQALIWLQKAADNGESSARKILTSTESIEVACKSDFAK